MAPLIEGPNFSLPPILNVVVFLTFFGRFSHKIIHTLPWEAFVSLLLKSGLGDAKWIDIAGQELDYDKIEESLSPYTYSQMRVRGVKLKSSSYFSPLKRIRECV